MKLSKLHINDESKNGTKEIKSAPAKFEVNPKPILIIPEEYVKSQFDSLSFKLSK